MPGIRPTDADDLIRRWHERDLQDTMNVGGYPGAIWEPTTPLVGFTTDERGEGYFTEYTWDVLRAELDELDEEDA